MTETESMLLTALQSCVAALREIDRAKGGLDEGAGSLLHDNPDPLAQRMNDACAHGQNSYLQASMLMSRLEVGSDGLYAVAFLPGELAALMNAADRQILGLQHLIEQVNHPGAEQRVIELRAQQQMWLALSARLTATAMAARS